MSCPFVVSFCEHATGVVVPLVCFGQFVLVIGIDGLLWIARRKWLASHPLPPADPDRGAFVAVWYACFTTSCSVPLTLRCSCCCCSRSAVGVLPLSHARRSVWCGSCCRHWLLTPRKKWKITPFLRTGVSPSFLALRLAFSASFAAALLLVAGSALFLFSFNSICLTVFRFYEVSPGVAFLTGLVLRNAPVLLAVYSRHRRAERRSHRSRPQLSRSGIAGGTGAAVVL